MKRAFTGRPSVVGWLVGWFVCLFGGAGAGAGAGAGGGGFVVAVVVVVVVVVVCFLCLLFVVC